MLDLKLDGFPWETLGPEFGKAQKKVIAAAKYLDPLLIRLKTEETKAAGARTSSTQADLFSIILPGMAVMFLLFIVQTLMRDIISEREDGKLRRMMTTPLRPLELIGARIFGGWVMGLAVLLVMVACGNARLPRPLGPVRLFPASSAPSPPSGRPPSSPSSTRSSGTGTRPAPSARPSSWPSACSAVR